jgi:hypothetical protein
VIYRLIERWIEKSDDAGLRAHAKKAMAHERHTSFLERRGNGRAMGPEVRGIDARVDELLRTIRDMAADRVTRADAEPAMVVQAEALSDAMFPRGLAALISLPYADQATAVQNIVHTIVTEHMEAVGALGLEREVEELSELAREYCEAVGGCTVDEAVIEAANKQGDAYLWETLAMLFGARGSATEPEKLAVA